MKFKNMCLVSVLYIVFALAMIPTVSAVEVGDKAPDFELASTQGGKLKLSSFQGKKNVVIEFYVLDFTPT
jgi:peroxiredoxin